MPRQIVTPDPLGSPDDDLPITSTPDTSSLLPMMGMEPTRLLWLGGLAAVTILGIIELPVAIVVAAGTYAAERLARS